MLTNLQRGIIFYGPPGNGKTISIKALMHTISKRTNPTVEMLYVKTFVTFAGPEYGILQIFMKARQMAPCMLIFEDIDSLVNPSVRSYFLNAVDGLESNHGILMIGSTNHLERLDPGIAKRPSRFDRKYFFAMPIRSERVQYAQYWRKKLSGNKKIEFPEVLCGMIADITDDFSFAYMKEAFVATLLVIVANKEEPAMQAPFPHQRLFFGPNVVFGDRVVIGGGGNDDPDGRKQAEKTLLWKEIQKQVKILRDEMENNAMQERTRQDMAAGDVEVGLYRMGLAPSRFQ
jgi:transitional endoplasmic reticulum ATPase